MKQKKPQKNSNNKSFLKLRDEWYAKLRKEGFNDIEDVNSPNEFLKRHDDHWFRTRFKTPMQFSAKQEYFYRAAHLLHTHTFETQLEKAIWDLHCQGYSYREIASMVTKEKVRKVVTKLKPFIPFGEE